MKSCFLLLLALLWSTLLPAQQPAPAPAAGTTPPVPQSHVGQVLFSAAPVPPNGYAQAAYIGYGTYALTPESRLYLTAFLTTSLPNALARLVPAAQGTDFMKRGSFQYCFFVDDVLVYTAYLEPDPRYLAEGNAQPVLHQPLITPEAARQKNPSLWALFLANGGKKVLPTGSHWLRLVIRPYLQSPLLQVGPVLAAGQVALNVTARALRAK